MTAKEINNIIVENNAGDYPVHGMVYLDNNWIESTFDMDGVGQNWWYGIAYADLGGFPRSWNDICVSNLALIDDLIKYNKEMHIKRITLRNCVIKNFKNQEMINPPVFINGDWVVSKVIIEPTHIKLIIEALENILCEEEDVTYNE